MSSGFRKQHGAQEHAYAQGTQNCRNRVASDEAHGVRVDCLSAVSAFRADCFGSIPRAIPRLLGRPGSVSGHLGHVVLDRFCRLRYGPGNPFRFVPDRLARRLPDWWAQHRTEYLNYS